MSADVGVRGKSIRPIRKRIHDDGGLGLMGSRVLWVSFDSNQGVIWVLVSPLIVPVDGY